MYVNICSDIYDRKYMYSILQTCVCYKSKHGKEYSY